MLAGLTGWRRKSGQPVRQGGIHQRQVLLILIISRYTVNYMYAIKGNIINPLEKTTEKTTVFFENGRIVSVGGEYKTKKEYDFSDYFISPGFIDAHIHIESSMLTPSNFAGAVLPKGTTAVVTDPHEIANVSGIPGITFMLNDAERTPMKLFFTAPSCVPATEFETSGARIGVEEIRELLKDPRCVGLGEVMNFPGVINRDREIMEKIRVSRESGKVIDGHAPGLLGNGLEKYVSAGISSDHECTTKKEAEERLNLGMRVMIREGSAMRNMNSLIDVVRPETENLCMFVSDDIHPETLVKEGHMDRILRKAVRLGINPVTALKMVTINPASYFSLKGMGLIAPGYYANFVVLKDLKNFEVIAVFVEGMLVARDGKLVKNFPPSKTPKNIRSSVRITNFSADDLRVRSDSNSTVRVIKTPNGSETRVLKSENGYLVPDINNDVLPLIVMERHHATGNIGKGFVKGFGLRSGSLASTVAHDSHNIICVGTDYD
ncbi:MAG TPA: adenine deaminase, partial [Candidatus Aenigmarchaeota archaeon]|nr:adenine deaminase [Candidatus Aenigmarchaeota archaeon]